MAKRVFLIVLDSLGIGYAPDAGAFGDVGANTLRRISASASFYIPNMCALGLGHVDGIDYLPKAVSPTAAHARMREVSRGKDTTVGHFELMGVISREPLPTYPEGFPKRIVDAFARECGRQVLCNKPYSGTDVIRDYGDEHLRTGGLIVYTSADSVFQIAAHEDVVPIEQLYEYCRIARRLLTGADGVGRVIARPFTGESGHYVRTGNRRDFSLEPPEVSVLDVLKEAGRDVIAVGKITDIFAGRGITESVLTHSNDEGMEASLALQDKDFHGLCFINLVEFDSHYGHRQDVNGYAAALSRFDLFLGKFIPRMREDDVLMITADHGCDPGDASTDHTREYVPLLILGREIAPVNLGTRMGFTEVGLTAAELLGISHSVSVGESLARRILK